jgi:hypothetical protein
MADGGWRMAEANGETRKAIRRNQQILAFFDHTIRHPLPPSAALRRNFRATGVDQPS